jgi:hypothetical protein
MITRQADPARPSGRGATESDPLTGVALLADVGTVDTVYRDVYLARAAAVLEPRLPRDTFRRLDAQRAELGALSLGIGRAIGKENWGLVRELSHRAAALEQAVAGTKELLELGRRVYAAQGVALDPFSPGLERFTRLSAKVQAALRTRVGEQLGVLEELDGSWKEFYASRRAAIAARAVSGGDGRVAVDDASSVDPREAAAQALKGGDMSRLARLADAIVASATSRPSASSTAATTKATPTPQGARPDLLVSYSSDTLRRARELGLAHRRLESRAALASLREYAWNPLSDELGPADIRSVPLPPDAPGGVRDLVEMMMIHPFVNSGGARYLPALVAEDILVEDFPETAEPAPASPLLASLGLPGRRALSRVVIERALLAAGSRVLEKDLGLDPRAFRLVCIPSDAYVRVGEAEGWGQQPLWTHLDGYLVMADGRLRALAGGDTRYGGLYDLLGVGLDYDSDRLVARFAVVQRERMVAW